MILVNRDGKPQPADVAHVFKTYIKVTYQRDGAKAYLARTADGHGTTAPAAYKTATQAEAMHAMLCNLDKAARERAAETEKATVLEGDSVEAKNV